jgi:hypothetical protein
LGLAFAEVWVKWRFNYEERAAAGARRIKSAALSRDSESL